MSYLDQFVPNVHFEKAPIKNLVSNQDYQRTLCGLAFETSVIDNFFVRFLII